MGIATLNPSYACFIMDAERTLPAKPRINNMPKDIGWRRALRIPS